MEAVQEAAAAGIARFQHFTGGAVNGNPLAAPARARVFALFTDGQLGGVLARVRQQDAPASGIRVVLLQIVQRHLRLLNLRGLRHGLVQFRLHPNRDFILEETQRAGQENCIQQPA